VEGKTVMNLKQCACLFIVLISLFCRFSKADAASTGQDYSLRGIDGVMVIVEILPSLKTDGLTRNQIYSDVETQLQKAGISVLLEKQWQTIEGRPYLHIEIIGTKIQDNWKFYTYSINVQLLQDVYLARKTASGALQASTWSSNHTGHGYLDDIRIWVKELINVFINAYTSVNPT
jgi:hypothetical protein